MIDHFQANDRCQGNFEGAIGATSDYRGDRHHQPTSPWFTHRFIMPQNRFNNEQPEDDEDAIDIVRRLKDNETGETHEGLDSLLSKSRQLNSPRSLRIIDQQLKNVPHLRNKFVASLVLTGNKITTIESSQLPNDLQNLELNGNFLKSIDGLSREWKKMQQLGLGFNEISDISRVLIASHWPSLCTLDLSYNLLTDLSRTIDSLSSLDKLRIVFLHGNPLSLMSDYRMYTVNNLRQATVLDDVSITTEERFRARSFSPSSEHPRNHASISISLGMIKNIPMPPESQSEWPVRKHRYAMFIGWFDGEKQVECPFDKMADYERFSPTELQTTLVDYRSPMDLSANDFSLTVDALVPLRDFCFRGSTCRFVHQLTEYWSPTESPDTDTKKKTDHKERKSDSGTKKKKPEDLSKLVTRTPPVETVFAQFHVDLRPLLDGDYTATILFKSLIQQQIELHQQQLAQFQQQAQGGKAGKRPIQDSRLESASQQKTKAKGKDAPINEPSNGESIPLPPPFECSVTFKLHRFVAQGQIV